MFNRLVLSIFGAIIIGSIVWTVFGQSEVALTISYIAAGFTFLVLVLPGREKGKRAWDASHEKPADPRELSFAGKVRGVIGLVLLGSAVCIGLWYAAISQLGPTPNPEQVPSDCDRIRVVIGAPQTVVCPNTKDPSVWKTFFAQYVTPLAGEDWPKQLATGLLKSCPATYIKAKEEPKCSLDIGSFSKEYDRYLNAKNTTVTKRLDFDPNAFLQALALVGILAGLNTLGIGISLASLIPDRTGLRSDAKKWLGKIGADTIFVICLYFFFNNDGYGIILGNYDPRLKPAVESLIAIGFNTAIAIPLVGFFTAASGLAAGELTKIGKGAGSGIAIGTVLIASIIAFFSASAGQVPGWMYTIGIVEIMQQNPGLDINLAIGSVVLGGIEFTGLISTLLGPVWTAFSIGEALIRGLGLAEKLGMLPPRD